MKVNDKVYDKTKRHVGKIVRTEIHDRLEVKMYVVKYRSGFIRSCHKEELKLIKK